MSMHNANRLKIGLFGANCSSGRAVTLVPERWSGSWPDNLKLATMADEAGIDFLLPIGRGAPAAAVSPPGPGGGVGGVGAAPPAAGARPSKPSPGRRDCSR